MNKQSNHSVRTRLRALLAASVGTFIMLSHTSCGVGGLFSKGDGDGEDSARIASAEPEKIRRKKGSLFNRAKERNSYIDDDIQTTRRDRFAAQNTASFTSPEPTPTPTPSMASRYNEDFAPEMIEPSNNIGLDPNPPLDGSPSPSERAEDSIGLPTLDSDFPQNLPTTGVDPYPDPSPRPSAAVDDGYIPLQLQPRLPEAESIQPPAE